MATGDRPRRLGQRSSPPASSGRWRRPRLGAAIAVVLVAWLALAAVQTQRLATAARAGSRAANAARDEIDAAADLLEGPPRTHLLRARTHFAEAHERAHSPVLAPLRILPVLGRQLRAVDALSVAAGTVASVGVDGLADVRRALDAPHRSGPQRVALLRRLSGIAKSAGTRLEGLDLGPGQALIAPVADAYADLAEEVTDLREALDDARAVSGALADLLEGPTRYLVLAGNNAEMRAGAGMPLSVGELAAADGRLRLGALRSVTEVNVPQGAVPLTGDFAARWGWLNPSQEWRNLMASPRFDVSAALAARMWEAAGHAAVDGVFLLDPVALKAILTATGPVEVGGRQISSQNILDELLVEQYRRFGEAEHAERREELGGVAQAAVASLDSGEWAPFQLAEGLARAARERHIMAWSRIADQQSAWHAGNVDATLQPDSLMVSVLNRGGNKLDPYLRVRAELRLRPGEDSAQGVLRLLLRNQAPPEGPGYVLGPHRDIPGAQEGEYIGLVAVNLPGATTAASIDDVPVLAAAGPDGPTQVVAAAISVPRGEERTMVVRFSLPARHGSLRVEPSARVPAVEWARGATSWTSGEGRRLEW